MRRVLIAREDQVPDGQAIKFEYDGPNGKPLEGFVTRFDGQWVAYQNQCRHIPMSLDYADGRFYTRDGKFFICQTHGAIYEPLSGLCVRGPCRGESLHRLPVEIVEGKIFLVQP